MSKFKLSIIVVAVVAIALGAAGLVYAQSPTPQAGVPGSGGYGMMGGRGGRGGMMGNAGIDQDGFLHDEMIAIFAKKLSISVEDLNARLTQGETMAQIATSKGLTAEQFSTLMTEVRSLAIDQAVKDGKLTQAQGEWMKQRGAGMMAGKRGAGGNRGAGQGQFANPNCPYHQTNP